MGFGTIRGTAGGGIPEAPFDNHTWGREDLEWSRVVSCAGDLMSGRLTITLLGAAVGGPALSVVDNAATTTSATIQNTSPVGTAALSISNNANNGIAVQVYGATHAIPALRDVSQLVTSGPLVFATRALEAMRVDVNQFVSVVNDPVDPPNVATKRYVDTVAGDIYDWQQDVEANTHRLNNVGHIGILQPADPNAAIIYTGQEVLRSTPAASNAYTFLRLQWDANNWAGFMYFAPGFGGVLNNACALYTNGPVPLVFLPSATEVMRLVAPPGRVGILNNNPQHTLDVNGQINTTTLRFPDASVQTTAWIDAPAVVGETFGRTFQSGVMIWEQALSLFGGEMRGPLILANDPTEDLEAATKQYVDQLATGAIHFIGTINAVTGFVTYALGSGFANGPLVTPDRAPGGFVICTTAGTINGGPANGITMEVGDWLLSNGVVWSLIPIGRIATTADQVSLSPPVFQANNVQNSLQNAEAEMFLRLPLAGGTMNGFLILNADPAVALGAVPRQYVDVRTIAAGGATGQALTKASAANFDTQWSNVPFEAPIDGLVYGRQNTQWQRAVAVAGDTMTGGLSFGVAVVADAADLTRHVRLWVGAGVTGFGFSITTGRLNYVVSAATNVHAFINPANTAVGQEWATISSAGVNAIRFTCTRENDGFQTIRAGWFYAATGQGLMLRQTTGNEQPQIENQNGTNRRIILDANNGVTLATAQTITGVKTFNTGITFGTATVATATDLTRHVRLYADTYGFSITGNRLNYVVSPNSSHVFLNSSNVEFGNFSATGVTTPVDGTGLITNGGGRFYKAVGTGVIIRQSSGNQQPQIENNDGTNRRAILDTTTANGLYVPLAGGTMTGLLVLSANPTANLGAATKQYVDSLGVRAWTAGQNYAVGQFVSWDNRVFSVVTAINNAPATPNFSTISPRGYGQTDYWEGVGDYTNWVAGNWVQIASLPSYGTYRVEICDLHVGNDMTLMIDITTGFNTGTAVVAGATHQGTGTWDQLRLSQATNGQAFLLGLRVAILSGTPNFKIFITGEARGTNSNQTVIPKPLAATPGGATLGGNTRAMIEDLRVASFASSGDIYASYGKTIQFGYGTRSDANDGKIGARLFNQGLNIVGIATEAGDNTRYISLYGTTVMRQAGDFAANGENRGFLLSADGGGGSLRYQAGYMFLQQGSNNTQPRIRNYNGSGDREIIDTVNGDARYQRSSGPPYGFGSCFDMVARTARVYSQGSDAGIGQNPPVLRANSNAIYVSNANWTTPLYLPNTSSDFVAGDAFFFHSDATSNTTIQNNWTTMPGNLTLTTFNVAVFVRNNSNTSPLWDLVGVIPTSLLGTANRFNSRGNSYSLPGNRGANGSWIRSDGAGGTTWSTSTFEELQATIQQLQARVQQLEQQRRSTT